MTEPTIVCPKCKNEIKLTESLAAPLIESTRREYEKLLTQKDPDKSYHAPHRVTDRDIFDNILIHGDNLLALKALEQEFAGKIKCIYIDPPYNTGSAFTHYDDGVEHSLWLSLMRDRLDILRRLLAADGAIWVSIDDNEHGYLRVLMDEVFGRANFVASVIWQKIFSPNSTARHLSANHDYVVLFAKDIDEWQRNLLPRSEALNENYSNPDNDPRGDWTSSDLIARNYYSAGTYSITSPGGHCPANHMAAYRRRQHAGGEERGHGCCPARRGGLPNTQAREIAEADSRNRHQPL